MLLEPGGQRRPLYRGSSWVKAGILKASKASAWEKLFQAEGTAHVRALS